MANVQITQGTQTPIRTTTISSNEYQHVVINQGTNSDSPFTGTVTEVTNLAKGTVTKLEGGTIGVIVAGTVSTVGLGAPNGWGTVVTAGTSAMGTIKAGIGGSAIYVTDLIISVGSASNVVIGNGGTGLPIAGTFFFNANGGLVTNNRLPIFTSQGSALVYKQSADGPISITAVGYVTT